MDLVRLALERCQTAEAVHCITDLIERYGQGGNCGYENRLRTSDSFLIADYESAWIVERRTHVGSETRGNVRRHFEPSDDQRRFMILAHPDVVLLREPTRLP